MSTWYALLRSTTSSPPRRRDDPTSSGAPPHKKIPLKYALDDFEAFLNDTSKPLEGDVSVAAGGEDLFDQRLGESSDALDSLKAPKAIKYDHNPIDSLNAPGVAFHSLNAPGVAFHSLNAPKAIGGRYDNAAFHSLNEPKAIEGRFDNAAFDSLNEPKAIGGRYDNAAFDSLNAPKAIEGRFDNAAFDSLNAPKAIGGRYDNAAFHSLNEPKAIPGRYDNVPFDPVDAPGVAFDLLNAPKAIHGRYDNVPFDSVDAPRAVDGRYDNAAFDPFATPGAVDGRSGNVPFDPLDAPGALDGRSDNAPFDPLGGDGQGASLGLFQSMEGKTNDVFDPFGGGGAKSGRGGDSGLDRVETSQLNELGQIAWGDTLSQVASSMPKETLDAYEQNASSLDASNAMDQHHHDVTGIDDLDPPRNTSFISVLDALHGGPRPLDGHMAVSLLCMAWTTHAAKLTSQQWMQVVESLLGQIGWWGLDAVLDLARMAYVKTNPDELTDVGSDPTQIIPDAWLPIIYQTASRLVRDPSMVAPEASTSASANKPPTALPPTTQCTDGFRTGAFREHPSAFFEIGQSGGVRLGGRGRCWGRLRGYAFCSWVNLKRAVGDQQPTPTAASAANKSAPSWDDEDNDFDRNVITSVVSPSEDTPPRELYHFGHAESGMRFECSLHDVGSKEGTTIRVRSKTNQAAAWTSNQHKVSIVPNRWHFIVVAHQRPYLFGKAKVTVFVDGQQQGISYVPFPSGKETDNCVLGSGLQGWMGAPSLFEGTEVGVPEAASLYDRTRVTVDSPHVVGGVDDDDVDDEDDEGTRGLGYGRDDAADQQVDAAEFVKEIASRTGIVGGGNSNASAAASQSASNAGGGSMMSMLTSSNTGNSPSADDALKKLKRMIFAFDPRAAHDDRCPELVIRGTKRGKRDALELTPDEMDSEVGHSLIDDEEEDDAKIEGDCKVRWETTVRKDAVELAGGARALLLTVRYAPTRRAVGDALMLLGDALHADAHLRTTFLGIEGFGLVAREVRRRFHPEDLTTPDDSSAQHPDAAGEEGVIVQVAVHMMRAAPANTYFEREFFYAGLRELLLDSRVSKNRAGQALRLISGLAAERPKWVRDAVGVDGLLRFMWRLEGCGDLQEELAVDVLRHVWSPNDTSSSSALLPTSRTTTSSINLIGPSTFEISSALAFVADHPASVGSRALVKEICELIDSNDSQTIRSLSGLGGVSYLLRLGSFAERNVKNPITGVIVRDPDQLPCVLGSSATPPETRCAMIRLIGTLLTKRVACIPTDSSNIDMALDELEQATDQDIVVQLGGVLAALKSVDYLESNELVLKALLDFLPKPGGFFVWAPLAIEANDGKGMTRVADALKRSAPLSKALINQRGWAQCFLPVALQTIPVGMAARACLVNVLIRSGENENTAASAKALEEFVKTSPSLIWSDCLKTMIENFHLEMNPNTLVKALQLARRRDFICGNEQERHLFHTQCLRACDYLRAPERGSYWQAAWSWCMYVLPTTTEVDVAAEAVKLAMSVANKELGKPTSDNRRRIFQFVKIVGQSSFEGSAGQLRCDACFGLVQTYSLADDGSVERVVNAALEKAETVQSAVKTIVDAMPTYPLVPDDVAVLDATTSPALEPSIWTAQKAASGGCSLRLKQALKARAVEDVRDRLAQRVTERVRDRRFDARWEKFVKEDGAERRAWLGNSSAWMVDESFCERGSRFRRRLIHMMQAEEYAAKNKVLSRGQLSSARQLQLLQKQKAAAANTMRTLKSATSIEVSNDLLKIGEEISKRTTVKGHSDLISTDNSEAISGSSGNDRPIAGSTEDLPNFPDTLPKFMSMATSNTAQNKPPADARAKKMSLEEWVNRTPLSIRGELEGRWVDPKAGEKILLAARAFIVRPRRELAGRLVVTNFAMYFDPDPPGAAGNYFKIEDDNNEDTGNPIPTAAEQDEFQIRQRWPLRGIQRVLLRRHRMLESALEVFMRGDSCRSVFVRFEDVSVPKKRCRVVRDRVVKTILSVLPRPARERSQHPKSNIRTLIEPATQAWRGGAMSNFDYLMELNMLAGRSVHDFCQYPVFPWILSDYRSEQVDLDNPASYRDLSKPMGALEPARLEQFVERYETFDDPVIPKFMFGSHYSTAAGVVLHFLVRLEPFRTLHVDMHDKRYDVPDRLFTSVPQAWEASSASQDLGEVKELTSEFYHLPAAFENRGKLDMGISQSGVPVDDVELPIWAKGSAQEFIRVMRKALESPITSGNLHKWIDLVFGYNQRGPNAVEARNVFYYLTYPGAVDLESIDDVGVRKAAELQIAHFGQCPEQLESNLPWPKREFVPTTKPAEFFLRPRQGVDAGFAIDLDVLALQARVVLRKPTFGVAAAAVFDEAKSDDGSGGGVLALTDDGSVISLVRPFADFEKADSKIKRIPLRGVKQPCVWSPDGNLIVFRGRAGLGTVELAVLDGTKGDGVPVARATLFAHEEDVTALAYDDGLLVTGSSDGAVRLWRIGRTGALRRPAVWTQPRRFLRGHQIGKPVTCASANRAMGVVATASVSSGVLIHDTMTGSLLYRLRDWNSVDRLIWDRSAGCVFATSRGEDAALRCASVDGTNLARVSGRDDEPVEDDMRVVCAELIAPGIVAVARPSSFELVELPTLRVLKSWPMPDIVAVTPPPGFLATSSSEFVQDDHVVVNLITKARQVFVLRRNCTFGGGQQAFSLLREAPTAVVGVVSGVVSGATRGVSLIGALDNVRKGVEVGKGVAGEAWDVFSLAASGFVSKDQQ